MGALQEARKELVEMVILINTGNPEAYNDRIEEILQKWAQRIKQL